MHISLATDLFSCSDTYIVLNLLPPYVYIHIAFSFSTTMTQMHIH